MDYEIEGVELWDGVEHRGPSTIRWSTDPVDGRIVSVEKSAAAASGLSVIPGLIDTHVHLVGFAGPGAPDFLTWPLVTRPEEKVLHALANARAALAGGVTTLRDLSADDVQFSLARALRAGVVDGPRILAYGMVGMTAGHADLFTPAAYPIRPLVADGPDACRALVRHWARAGADGIKIATSGGVLSVGDRSEWRNYTTQEIAAIVDEAHALGMRVAAHAHTENGIERALDAGVDSIEHATLITPDLAARTVAAGVSVAPTLLINDSIAAGGGGASLEQAQKASDLVALRDSRMLAAAALGVEFTLGTDANGRHVRFGDEMREVRSMAATFAWPAQRALAAATSRAAAAIGRGSDLGRVGPGYLADLVVVEGRPWENIDALDVSAIRAVVSRGRVVVGSLYSRVSTSGSSSDRVADAL